MYSQNEIRAKILCNVSYFKSAYNNWVEKKNRTPQKTTIREIFSFIPEFNSLVPIQSYKKTDFLSCCHNLLI